MRRKKTKEEKLQLVKMGAKLGIFHAKVQEAIIPLVGQKKISDDELGEPFGLSGNAIQKCRTGKTEMSGAFLFKLFEYGQSIDAFFSDGTVTIAPERLVQLFAAQELEEASRKEVSDAIINESANIEGTKSPTREEKRADNQRDKVYPKPSKP